jgi:single-strand DNA-binding protein
MLNKIEYQGRLTADVELKQTQSGVSFTEFTVAWSEKYKEIETKCFLRCKAWRQTAEFVSKYFKKGSEILIEGRLVTEQWEKDGQSQSRTICDVEKVHFCGSKSDNATTAPAAATQPAKMQKLAADEDIPF